MPRPSWTLPLRPPAAADTAPGLPTASIALASPPAPGGGGPNDTPIDLLDREWLVTNGLGGYASGTVLGPPTRRHHGVFIPNLAEPPGRYVIVPRLDEAVDGVAGPVALGGVELADRPAAPRDAGPLRSFRLEGATPVWVFEVEGSRIERSLVMPHGRNTVCVRWRLLAGPPKALRVRCFLAGRRQDAELCEADTFEGELGADGHGGMHVRFPASGIEAAFRTFPPGAAFEAQAQVDRSVLLRVERDRGYGHLEHMHSPGHWRFELRADQPAAVLVGLEGEFDAMGLRDAGQGQAMDPDALFAAEAARQAALAAAVADDPVEARLALAADAFIVLPSARRGSGREDQPGLRSIMAGYPWFNDWGRDTMIALEGLTLACGREHEARAILRTFAGSIRDGLIPNLYPEGDREPLYHTVDATLWFFHALDRYLDRTDDASLLDELYPALEDVVAQHRRGTRFGIAVDPEDGLVRAAAEGLQLTWMDAKVHGWVVTPRRGKPVEIQALWFNALRLMAQWARRLGRDDASARSQAHEALAARVHASFNRRYWCAERGHLLDVIDGPDGDDARLRPNQIVALSLRHPVLDLAHGEAVLATVERELLTPCGLRTLARGEPGYRSHYQGDLPARDAAYHQGTVWPWLLGPFVDAWLRVRGRPDEARALLEPLVQEHLGQACVGQISEVFDAEAPHRPGGCIAQAWSVAEVLRAWQRTRKARHG